MFRSIRYLAALCALATLGIGAPVTARAGDCESSLVIFSQNSAAPTTANGNALKCDADNSDDADARLINPGSDRVFVRYIVDLGASVPSLPGFLDGLGFTHKPITLRRQLFHLIPGAPDVADLGYTYQTDLLALPAGAQSSGCITATIYDPSDPDFVEPLDMVTFHTIDQQPAGC